MSIKEEVIEVVAKQLGLDPKEVTPEKSFIEDLHADSLDVTELIMTFEESYNFTISEEEAGQLKTVGDVIKHIEEKKVD